MGINNSGRKPTKWRGVAEMEEEKETEQEAPKYSDIAAELKQMAMNLKEAFKTSMESERAKELVGKAQDVFENFVGVFENLGRDIKSGKLERGARSGIHQTLQDLNKKLKEYSESAKSEEKE
jgi:hypothetical protein